MLGTVDDVDSVATRGRDPPHLLSVSHSHEDNHRDSGSKFPFEDSGTSAGETNPGICHDFVLSSFSFAEKQDRIREFREHWDLRWRLEYNLRRSRVCIDVNDTPNHLAQR